MKRRIAQLTIVMFILPLCALMQAIHSAPVQACSCPAPISPMQALEEAEAVFVGTVVAITDEQHATETSGTCTLFTYRFSVARALKGVTTDQFEISTNLDC